MNHSVFHKMKFFSYSLSYVVFASILRFDLDPLLNFMLYLGSVWFFYHFSEYEFFPIDAFRILPFHKQSYIVTNVVKAHFLLILCVLSFRTLPFLMASEWSPKEVLYVKNLGALYAALDFTSVFYNQAMSRTTMFHHVCVVLFFVQNYFDDYSSSSVCRLIMLYAMFSSAAFYINLLLALRHVYDLSYRTYTVAFWTFLTTTLINWFVQLQLMARIHPISLLFYLLPLVFVVNDDIILLQWLLDRATITN